MNTCLWEDSGRQENRRVYRGQWPALLRKPTSDAKATKLVCGTETAAERSTKPSSFPVYAMLSPGASTVIFFQDLQGAEPELTSYDVLAPSATFKQSSELKT